MVGEAPAESARGPACYRCDDPLVESQQIRLSVAHEGAGAETYVDVERHICVDCVAALGMLEFRTAVREDVETEESASPLRSLPADSIALSVTGPLSVP